MFNINRKQYRELRLAITQELFHPHGGPVLSLLQEWGVPWEQNEAITDSLRDMREAITLINAREFSFDLALELYEAQLQFVDALQDALTVARKPISLW